VYAEASLRKRQRQVTGAASYLEHARAGRESRGIDVFEHPTLAALVDHTLQLTAAIDLIPICYGRVEVRVHVLLHMNRRRLAVRHRLGVFFVTW